MHVILQIRLLVEGEVRLSSKTGDHKSGTKPTGFFRTDETDLAETANQHLAIYTFNLSIVDLN